MNRSFLCKLSVFACLLAVHITWVRAAGHAEDVPRPEQTQFVAIVVNGRTLTGPNSSANRRDGHIFLPVMSVARALGDAINVDIAARSISVRRQTGVASDFDARLGRVRENGSVILTVTGSNEIIFTPTTEELLLPVEIASAIFGVSIRYDDAANSVIVNRGQAATQQTQSQPNQRFADLYQLDYEYNLNSYASSASQNLVLNAAGRLADGRFSFSSNSMSTAFRQVPAKRDVSI